MNPPQTDRQATHRWQTGVTLSRCLVTVRSGVTEYRDPWCLSSSAGRTSIAIVPETPRAVVTVTAKAAVAVTVQTGERPYLQAAVHKGRPFHHWVVCSFYPRLLPLAASLSEWTNQQLQCCVRYLQHNHPTREGLQIPPCYLRKTVPGVNFCHLVNQPLPPMRHRPVSMDWTWSVSGRHRWIFRPQMSTNSSDCADSSHTGPSPIRARALTTQSTLTEAIIASIQAES